MSHSPMYDRPRRTAVAALGLTCLAGLGLAAVPTAASAAGSAAKTTGTVPALQGAAALVPAPGLGQAPRARHAAVAVRADAVVGAELTTGQSLSAGEALTTADGRYSLVMAADGNLLVQKAANAVAAAPYDQFVAAGAPGSHLVLQADGNVVLYQPDGTAAFATGTFGTGPRRLVVQGDGNVVLYSASDQALYATRIPSALQDGGSLLPGERLVSPDGATVLVMQTDGNLVLYRSGQVRYASGTHGPVAGLAIQDDGNVVLYSATGQALFATGTGGGVDLEVEDGEFRVFEFDDSPEPLAVVGFGSAWGTGTLEPGQVLLPGDRRTAGGVQLIMQVDGNLVEYVDGRARFATRTQADVAIMQLDGNLVVYAVTEGGDVLTPQFQTRTAGHPGSRLVVQADGNVVVYTPAGQAVFATRR